jgi:hypothetical protein
VSVFAFSLKGKNCSGKVVMIGSISFSIFLDQIIMNRDEVSIDWVRANVRPASFSMLEIDGNMFKERYLWLEKIYFKINWQNDFTHRNLIKFKRIMRINNQE